jgi:isopenicillin-N epimerase
MSPTTNTLRDEFLLDPGITFLNHGSFGATPRRVFECYQRWQRELEFEPVEFFSRRAPELLRASRTILAEFLSTQPSNLVYVQNATVGLNIVARSLNLGPGDEVLSSDHEYGALDRTWKFFTQKRGFKYINYPIPSPVSTIDAFVDAFWKGVTPHTRVIFISHITSPTAIIFPIKELCSRARKAGIITIIDGAHGPGQIPLSLDDLGADIYCGNLHKWLCAPKGSAFLFARPEIQPLIEPLIISWGWQSENPGPSPFIDLHEWAGTRDISAFLAVPEAIRFQQDFNWDKIRSTCHCLTSELQHKIVAITGIPPLHPDSPDWFAQMGAAFLPDWIDAETLQSRLFNEFNIEVPITRWNSHKLVRFSLQAYNSQEDIIKLEKVLSTLLRQ